MESEGKLGRLFSTLGDKLNEQVWFQQLKGKWEELDPQSRTYLRAAGIGLSSLLVLVLVLSSIFSVRALRHDLNERTELLGTIQTAGDEMRRLRESNPAVASGSEPESGPWAPYFETIATQAGMEKSVVTIGEEKPGTNSELAKEALIEVSLKKVNIKQVVRYAFQLESGRRPVKLRNLTIDTQMDPSGYLNATLAVSAFKLVTTEK